MLVIDEDAATLGDRRLVAHLAADEPPRNAELVGRLYLADPHGRHARAVLDEDWRRTPGAPSPTRPVEPPGPGPDALFDADGRSYRLAVLPDLRDGAQLRWTRTSPHGRISSTVGLREVVGALQAYEPACTLTEAAIRRSPDTGACTPALAGQLQRLRRSPTVLNRPRPHLTNQPEPQGGSPCHPPSWSSRPTRPWRGSCATS